MTRPTLRQIAWHEAGHAVVAWDQKFTVTLVSIRRTGAGYGRSEHTPAVDCAIPSERERENIVAMAGWAAELESGEAGERDLRFRRSRCVLRRLDQHAPSRVEIELGWAECEAQRIVSANLERIERLAHALMSREELTSATDTPSVEVDGRPRSRRRLHRHRQHQRRRPAESCPWALTIPVAYYRVSTGRQGKSGLGLEAQRAAVETYLNGGDWQIVDEYTEVESGKRPDRPALDKALAAARLHRASLVVSKVDRLTRSVAFLSRLLEAGVDVRFADLPQIEGATGRFMLQQMVAVAELEAGMIMRPHQGGARRRQEARQEAGWQSRCEADCEDARALYGGHTTACRRQGGGRRPDGGSSYRRPALRRCGPSQRASMRRVFRPRAGRAHGPPIRSRACWSSLIPFAKKKRRKRRPRSGARN